MRHDELITTWTSGLSLNQLSKIGNRPNNSEAKGGCGCRTPSKSKNTIWWALIFGTHDMVAGISDQSRRTQPLHNTVGLLSAPQSGRRAASASDRCSDALKEALYIYSPEPRELPYPRPMPAQHPPRREPQQEPGLAPVHDCYVRPQGRPCHGQAHGQNSRGRPACTG